MAIVYEMLGSCGLSTRHAVVLDCKKKNKKKTCSQFPDQWHSISRHCHSKGRSWDFRGWDVPHSFSTHTHTYVKSYLKGLRTLFLIATMNPHSEKLDSPRSPLRTHEKDNRERERQRGVTGVHSQSLSESAGLKIQSAAADTMLYITCQVLALSVLYQTQRAWPGIDLKYQGAQGRRGGVWTCPYGCTAKQLRERSDRSLKS